MFLATLLGLPRIFCHFELVNDIAAASLVEPPIMDSSSLGWMLHDIEFGVFMKPGFFRAEMKGGVIDLTGIEVRR